MVGDEEKDVDAPSSVEAVDGAIAPQPKTQRPPIWQTFAAATVCAAALAVALRPSVADTWVMWASLLLGYAVLTAWAVRYLKQRGLLGQLLRLRAGDASIGIVMGLAMVTAGLIAMRSLFPVGSTSQEWLFQIYAQVGDVQSLSPRLAALLAMALMEEVVWRGWVMDVTAENFGPRVAVPLTAVLYSAVHLPTLLTLSTANAGLNPLLLLAALGAGLWWGFAARAFGRLWPVVFTHAVFSFFLAAPPPPWLGF